MKGKNRAGKSPFLLFATGTLIGLIAAGIWISLFALIITKEDFSSSFLPVFLLIAGFCGSFTASVIITRKTKIRGILSGLISAVIFSFLFMLICICAGKLQLHPKILLLLPVDLVGGMIGGVIAKNMRK